MKERKSRELAGTFAEKLTLLKNYFPRISKPSKKARTKLTKTFAKNLEADFRNLTLLKEAQAMKTDFAKKNHLLAKTLPENLEAYFRSLRQFAAKLFE